jgi:hypothetical protein
VFQVNGMGKVEVQGIIFPLNPEHPDESPEGFPPVWGEQKISLTEIILEAFERDKKAKAT